MIPRMRGEPPRDLSKPLEEVKILLDCLVRDPDSEGEK